jgi:hypothetical protein
LLTKLCHVLGVSPGTSMLFSLERFSEFGLM